MEAPLKTRRPPLPTASGLVLDRDFVRSSSSFVNRLRQKHYGGQESTTEDKKEKRKKRRR